MQLSKAEMETIIRFDEAGIFATVYTYNAALKRKLGTLADSRDDIHKTEDDQHGGVTYEMPKKWIKIAPPRVLSEAQKQACREKLLLARSSAKSGQ